MAHKPAAVPLERADHRIDVLGTGEEHHRGGSLRYLAADLVKERAPKLRTGVLGGDAPGHAPCDYSRREPGRTEKRPGRGPRRRALSHLLPDELLLVVGIDVATRNRAANHDAVTPVVLHERDFLCPRDTRNLARCA